MAKQVFTDPYGKDTLSLEECTLDKILVDLDSRAQRIPKIDENYVDLGTQYKLAKLIESKQLTFNNFCKFVLCSQVYVIFIDFRNTLCSRFNIQ